MREGEEATSDYRDPSLTLSGCSDLLGKTSNDSAGCIMLVEGVRELLASRLQLLPQSEAVQHDRILERDRRH